MDAAYDQSSLMSSTDPLDSVKPITVAEVKFCNPNGSLRLLAHESEDRVSPDPLTRLGSQMDIHNNAVGYEEWFTDWEASDETMCRRIRSMARAAQLNDFPGTWGWIEALVNIERAHSRFVSGGSCAIA